MFNLKCKKDSIMTAVKTIKVSALLILLSGLSTNAMQLDIDGETTNFTPKVSVRHLATIDDKICGIGVPDLTTPLGLGGTIIYGFKDTPSEQNSIGIAGGDSMEAIFNKLKNQNIVSFTPTPTQLTMFKVSNLDIIFALGPISTATGTQWKLSMETKKPGNLLFFNTSGIAPFGNQVMFMNGTTSTIMNTIFPHESTKTFTDVAATYYLNDDSTTIYTNRGNTLTYGDIFTLNFRSAMPHNN